MTVDPGDSHPMSDTTLTFVGGKVEEEKD